MRLQRTAAPVLMPVTVSEARDHCRFTSTAEDDVFEGFIAAAVDLLDGPSGLLGRCLMQQTWLLELPGGWPSALRLPLDPVLSVAVKYFDASGGLLTLDASRVDIIRYPSQQPLLRIVGDETLPSLGAVDWPIQMEIVTGFGATADDVPSAIRTAIKMMVSHWHRNRDAVSEKAMAEVPMAANALLGRWRLLL